MEFDIDTRKYQRSPRPYMTKLLNKEEEEESFIESKLMMDPFCLYVDPSVSSELWLLFRIYLSLYIYKGSITVK